MEGQSRLHQEIRRLRQYLEAIKAKGCISQEACGVQSLIWNRCPACIADKALSGFESGNPVKWTLYMHDDGSYTLKSGSKVAINMLTENEAIAFLRSKVTADDSVVFKSYRTIKGPVMDGSKFVDAPDTDIAAMLQQI